MEDETVDIHASFLPGPEEKKTILRERPKFFKFGEAIFRSDRQRMDLRKGYKRNR